MTNDPISKLKTDAPATYNTPQRPGQTGAQDQQRIGPNPHSQHPTGPHAPYDVNDLDGFSAVKNVAASEPEGLAAPARKGLDGENFQIVDSRKKTAIG